MNFPFYLDCRTLRSGTTYSQSLHPRMSINAENISNVFETYNAEEITANNDRSSSELTDERIRTNLEPLNEQTLTQLLNQLIEDNLAKSTPTAGSRTNRPQMRPPLNREIGKSEPRELRPTTFFFAKVNFSSFSLAYQKLSMLWRRLCISNRFTCFRF